MLKSEVEAEELEKKAKQELKNKNYEVSKSLFEKARDINIQLNYMGKVGIIEKQLAQIKRVILYEQRSEKKPIAETKSMKREVQEKEEPILKLEIGKTKEIQVKEPKEDLKLDDRKEILSEAELRRARIREQVAQREKEAELKGNQDVKIKEREVIKKKEIQRSEQEFKVAAEKENEKQLSIKDAEIAMDRAKMAIDNKEFEEAKVFYKEAIDIFKIIGWFDQVDILYKEIKHVEIYKEEYLKKKILEAQRKQQKEEQYQKRVDILLEDKKQKDELRSAKFKKIPLDIKNTIDKVNLLIEKAEKEVNAKIYQRALNRYQYILELYKSIPLEKLDLTSEKLEIKKKIDDLKLKV